MIKKIFITFTTILVIISIFISCGCLDDTSNLNKIIIKGKDGNYLTIMNAINESSQGDIILIDEGIYNETLIIDKSISLYGKNKNSTVISGNKTGDVIRITANYVNISGFTIINSGNIDYPNVDSGIGIYSDNNTITNNNFNSNDNCGIYIYRSSNNKINNNFFYNKKYGIFLKHSTKNNITQNVVSSISEYGIYLEALSNNNTISDNIISDNKYGSRIKGSMENEILKNIFKNNEMGLYFCCGGNNNTIVKNIFLNNSEWNAKGYPINTWDDGTKGNYWDDYNGSDEDGDGIGDTPYIIIGYQNIDGINEDRYPLIDL
jgi:parallel beta-helix repeat protein